MKNIFLLLMILSAFSCQTPAGETEIKGVGFFKPMPEETFIAGSDEITEIWNQYPVALPSL